MIFTVEIGFGLLDKIELILNKYKGTTTLCIHKGEKNRSRIMAVLVTWFHC